MALDRMSKDLAGLFVFLLLDSCMVQWFYDALRNHLTIFMLF